MLVKLLGIIDFIAAILLFLLIWNFSAPESLIWIFGTIILIKGIAFAITRDIASVLDIYSGIIILLTLAYNVPTIYLMLGCFFLLQKSIMSFM